MSRQIRRRRLAIIAAITASASIQVCGRNALAAAPVTLFSFTGNGLRGTGANPYAGLTVAGEDLYGTTFYGGPFNRGVVFKYTKTSGTFTIVHSFAGSDGSNPFAGLTVDAGGNVYGTAQSGGAVGYGTLFKINAGTQTTTPIVSFNGSSTGGYPMAAPLIDSSGNIYGTTTAGGGGGGTVFKIAAGTNTIVTLASFNGINGSTPQGGLILVGGTLYGTTSSGGANNKGTIFGVSETTGVLTTLFSFDGANGAAPESTLIADSSGNLYGSTTDGSAGCGTVFKFAVGTKSLSTLASFDGNRGRPYGGVISDSVGNLFGTTQGGGSFGGGTVFEIAAGSGKFTTLASFVGGSDGIMPYGGLAVDSKGDFFGTTVLGGSTGNGALFQLSNTGFVVPEPSVGLLSFLLLVPLCRRQGGGWGGRRR